MAEEDKSRSIWPWIIGIIGLFILAALLLPFLAQNQGQQDPEIGIGGGFETPITDLEDLLDQDNLSNLAGREVNLESVPVEETVNDNLFWVGNNPERRILVSLNEGLPNMGESLNLQPGEVVDIRGQLKEIPSEEEIQQRWNLEASEIEFLQNQGAFIQATGVQVRRE